MTTLYLSDTGRCVCDKHLREGGAYLESEVKEPRWGPTTTSDGVTTIQTPLDTWLVITPELAADMSDELEDIHCEHCVQTTMNERERFIARAALIYLTANLHDANEAFETASPHRYTHGYVPEVKTISVNGDDGDVIGETEINDLLLNHFVKNAE